MNVKVIAEIDGTKYIIEKVLPISEDGARIDKKYYLNINKVISDKEEITLPSLYDGIPVTGIGSSATQDCKNLKVLNIPDSYTSLTVSCFKNTKNLETVNFDESSNIKTIPALAFEDCVSLKNVNLPKSVETILWNCFANCKSLTHFTCPENLKVIGQDAFKYSSVSDIHINKDFVFSDCCVFEDAPIEKITVDERNKTLYSKDNVLYSRDNRLLFYPTEKKDARFTVPENIETIGTKAIVENQYIKKLLLPEKCTSLAFRAIVDCKNLNLITLRAKDIELNSMSIFQCPNLVVKCPHNCTYVDQLKIYGIETSSKDELSRFLEDMNTHTKEER